MNRLKNKNNFGCILRDGLEELRYEKKVPYQVIKERLFKIGIPEKYFHDIAVMVNYKKFDRITNSMELLLESYVHLKILEKIVKEERDSK